MIAGITKVFTVSVSFFFIPIMIKNIGVLEFGLLAYLQIFTIFGFLSMVSFGLGPPIIKYVAELTVSDNYDDIYKIINTTFLTLLSIGIIVSMIGLYFSDNIVNNLNVPDAQLLQFKEGFRLVFLTIIFILPFSVFGNVLEGLQKYKIFKSLETLFWVGYMITAMYLSYQHVSFEKIFTLFLFLQVVQHFLFFIFVQLHYKRNIFLISQFSFGWLKKMFQMGKYLTLMGIVGAITRSLEKLFIGIYLSPLFISYYEIIFKIPNVLKNIFSWVDVVIIPATAEISIKEKFNSLSKLFTISLNVKIILLYPLIVLLLFFTKDILSLWISSDYTFLAKYIQMLLLWNIIVPLSNHGSKYLIGLNKLLYQLMIYNSVSNLLKLFIIIILIDTYGLLAIVFGYLTLIFPTPLMFGLICKQLNVKKWIIYKNIAIAIITSSIFIIIPYIINVIYDLSESGLLICLIIYFIISYYINTKIIMNMNLSSIPRIVAKIKSS